jgi:penicillin G amidase
LRTAGRVVAILALVVAAIVAAFFVNVAVGMRAHARYADTISGLPLRSAVSIIRDDRGVPHISAANDDDLYFAQGYVEGADRLFQMDLERRFVEGRLAEVFGGVALPSDEAERSVPVRAIVTAQWQSLNDHARAILVAFSNGVNAAIQREPLPVEFRVLEYRPAPWTPEDSLSIGMAEVLDLIDDWNAIAPRDAVYRRGGQRLLEERFPLSDPCYDAPVVGGLRAVAPGANCPQRSWLIRELRDPRAPIGSNEWAVGANRALTHRALLANDPHLALSIPGVWYLADLRAPELHVAGATLSGVPGIVLGHNEFLAWGMTDATVASLSVFEPPAHLDPSGWRTEAIGVRFGSKVTQRYYSTAHDFGVTTDAGRFVLVRWPAYEHPAFAGTTFDELARARSVQDGLVALRSFQGPAHNFVLADTAGRVAYTLAGPIPNDPVWAMHFHPARDLSRAYPVIPFDRLPQVAPSRDGVVWTANNRMYGAGYPLQLSPQFAPPYRAYRIAQLLRARPKYDVAYFAQMQMDVLSLPERELAHRLASQLRNQQPATAAMLAAWNGEMTGDSTTATLVQAIRLQLTQGQRLRMTALLAKLRTSRIVPHVDVLPSPDPWSVAGSVRVFHKLSALGIDALNGVTLPGYGDAYTLHVQYPGYSQSFRAVWDVGNWDAGGITLPQGESGEPGSGHYTDQAAAWIAGQLWPLPFSEAVVKRTAVDREMLLP